MSDSNLSGTDFDLSPDPRILPMLGEITLKQDRCLAEFIDNSVDAFLSIDADGDPNYEIHISVPTSDSPSSRITVRDNGPGMSVDHLERAVRAGWTGNDPIHNLGLFGMGFNIATARLGTVTRVWTATADDVGWCGLEIDFGKLIKQQHYRTPRLSRPKDNANEHGTEITIERLKPEQREWFSKARNRSNISKQLGDLYSSMLRVNGAPTHFSLTINGTPVRSHLHCIWGDETNQRSVELHRSGTTDAFQTIDRRLPDRLYCTNCWQWLPANETSCLGCRSSSSVVQRERRVHGWLGIQRYLSRTAYGIDFLRHGRKIEIRNMDLFRWIDDRSDEVEYPIDDPRSRGRIVGEIHLDHCRVTYTKNRFDRNDPAWEEMRQIVRGNSPLRPDKARDLGFGENSSPLYRLFQAFRRTSPKSKVAGCYARLLIVHDNPRAEHMATRFYAGEADYQTDEKWWELVEEADNALLAPETAGEGQNTGDEVLDGFGGDASTDTDTTPAEEEGEEEVPDRPTIPSLTREYLHDSSTLKWDVKAYSITSSDPILHSTDSPWVMEALTHGLFNFFVDVHHPVFRSSTMTPLDGLIAELSSLVVDFTRGRNDAPSFAVVLSELRHKYTGIHRLDPVAFSHEANVTLNTIARSLTNHISPDDALALFQDLSPSEQEEIQRGMAGRPVSDPQGTIRAGQFLEYGSRRTLFSFVSKCPELFFDGKCWDERYAELGFDTPAATEVARKAVLDHHLNLLADAIWLADNDPEYLDSMSRERLIRAALSLDLLSPRVDQE